MKKAFKYTDNRFLCKFNNGGRFGKLSIYLGFGRIGQQDMKG